MDLKKLIYLVKKNLTKFTLSDHIRGAWFARKLTRHGIIVVSGGSPMPKIINEGGEIITDNCQFYSGVRLEVGKNALLTIGKGTYLNRNTVVIAREKVEIGKACRIAWDVVIMDSDMHSIQGRALENKPVIIEDNVWIGCRCIILKGVRIGSGSIVAAGSVVTKDIPPNSIIAGVPAKVLSHRSQQEIDSQKIES